MKKGFTLMELIVVVIIVGILAMVGLPQFFQVAERGRAAEAFGILGAVRSAQVRYYAENSAYLSNSTCGGLDINFTTPKYFGGPNCGATSANMTKSTGSIYGLKIYYANGTIACDSGTCPKLPD
ncbi:MAG: prepilin-type N-terminal cleavage/methylation domain-containing protein [Candidatus Omnitrophota bacterium]